MTEEVIIDNCSDFDHRVRFVQLIASPELSRLEVIIYPDGSQTDAPPTLKPSAYYQIRALPFNSASTSVKNPPHKSIPPRCPPRIQVSYIDNVFGYFQDDFSCVEHYMLQRFSELRFVGSHNWELRRKRLIDCVDIVEDSETISDMLCVFSTYCERKGFFYARRKPLATETIRVGKSSQDYSVINLKSRKDK